MEVAHVDNNKLVDQIEAVVDVESWVVSPQEVGHYYNIYQKRRRHREKRRQHQDKITQLELVQMFTPSVFQNSKIIKQSL